MSQLSFFRSLATALLERAPPISEHGRQQKLETFWRYLKPAAALGVVFFFISIEARAQLALPGAVAPTPAGVNATSGRKSASGGEAHLRPVMLKAPAEDTIIGKTLKRDGFGSEIEFSRNGADLEIKRLIFIGDRLSRSGEQCRVEVSGASIKLAAKDGLTGLKRYQIDAPACAFSLDVLDGAVLVSNEGKACELKSSDCRADPAGLWGMTEGEFDPKKAADMLAARADVEKTMRGNFRALYDRNKKEKELRNSIVREQAGFSSRREEICRSYAKESEFGYCALRLTEARAILLGAQFAAGSKATEPNKGAPGSTR